MINAASKILEAATVDSFDFLFLFFLLKQYMRIRVSDTLITLSTNYVLS